MTFSRKGWTFGAEHELADWDQSQLPELAKSGWKMDRRDVTIVNSNGIAADPTGKLYRFGGELNSPPTYGVDGQLDALHDALKALGRGVPASVNYRSNLHCHIRVPGLAEDLPALKRIARFNDRYLVDMLVHVEPIPDPRLARLNSNDWQRDHREPITQEEAFNGAMRRFRRRRVSHHTVLNAARAERQQAAQTFDEFMAAECPQSRAGVPQWHLAPRCAVNLRQLRETDTIEFRHFPGTLDLSELRGALTWCTRWLQMALEDPPVTSDAPMRVWVEEFVDNEYLPIPTFPLYCHWQEKRYRMTCHDGSLSKSDIAANIRLILASERHDELVKA